MVNKNWWHPYNYEQKIPSLILRNKVIKAIKDFFLNQDFLEVDTPYLQTSPGMDVHMKAFKTELENPLDKNKTLYLHTSPEFAMKKLLAAGLPKIFQIAHVYRNGEISPYHSPEFTMIEWYRANADYYDIMNDCEELLKALVKLSKANSFRANGAECFMDKGVERKSINELFYEYVGFYLTEVLPTEPSFEPPPEAIGIKAKELGIEVFDYDRFEDIYFRIMVNKIEPFLGLKMPIIIYDFPLCMGALSKASRKDARFAERFEIYACGVELGNAYSELIDPKIQLERFKYDMGLKEKFYGYHHPLDENYLAAFDYGMPESAGIGFGVDRIIMLITGAKDINDILWAPLEPF